MTAPRPTSPEARALAELLDVLEPAFGLTPSEPARPIADAEPRRAARPTPKQQPLDLN